MSEEKRRHPDFQRLLRRIDALFLGRYRLESLAVRTNLRMLLGVLLLGFLAVLVTGPMTFLVNPNLRIRAIVVGVMVFFPLLLWLLRRGCRNLVVLLFTVVLSVVITVPYLIDAGETFNAFKTDRLSMQILLQLILVAAITEKASYLVLGFTLLAGALSFQSLVLLWPASHGNTGLLQTIYVRALVNLTLATGVLLILQQSFHRAICQVEAANRTLEARVQERTEQLQHAQRTLVEGERLAVLGRLSASVAHEINTPLAAIQSSNQTIRLTLPEVLGRAVSLFRRLTAEQEEVLIDILDRSLSELGSQGLERRRLQKQMVVHLSAWGIAEATTLAEKLMDAGISELSESWRALLSSPDAGEVGQFISDFAAVLRSGQIIDAATQKATQYILALRQSLNDQNALQPRLPVDLSQSLEAVLTLLKGRVGSGIQIVKSLEAGLEVVGQPGRLMQAWSNLITNALDAMGGEGVLTLASRSLGSDVEVTVGDNGPGISLELKDKLFDPFVTTKPLGVGTGMGLGIVRAIIAEHDGSLTFESAPGHTQFHVRLPLVPAKEP